jgi:hypothetical protein
MVYLLFGPLNKRKKKKEEVMILSPGQDNTSVTIYVTKNKY